MQHRLSYIVWKIRPIWPVVDLISRYYILVIYLTSLLFALYYQISVLWLLIITVCLTQFWIVTTRQINK